ncbi:MAG: ABC transporter ATP-binding protein [bacterium]
MALIEADSLRRSYRRGAQEVNALRGVSLEVREGELLALSGPSGSGKTTLLHVLGLLDPGFEGELTLRDRAVHALSPVQRTSLRLREIGFVFQDYQLLGYLSLRDNVALPHWRAHGNRRAARRRADELLERVGLEARARHRTTELSGGELQRGALARALVNDPAVILADEPTGSLDSTNADEVLALLAELCEQGRTLVVASHNPALERAAARVLRLRDGRLDSEVE